VRIDDAPGMTAERWIEPSRLVTAAYQLAGAGFLFVFELPFVGVVMELAAAALVVLGTRTLADLVPVGPRARALRLASQLAVVVAVTTVVLVVAALASWFGAGPSPVPGPSRAVLSLPAVQTVLGVTGTLLVTAGMGHELRARGEQRSADAWFLAQAATVLIHTPIAVTVLLSATFGGEAHVGGATAVGLFLVAMLPFALLARAGAVSARELAGVGAHRAAVRP
jgi:hypothetical protein